MPTITLQSSDGDNFVVDVEAAKCFTLIRTMLDDLGMNENEEEEVIPLPIVNSVILEKLIEWAMHHKNDPPAPEGRGALDRRTDNISSWDKQFLTVEQHILLELTVAANYLDITGLMEATCKTIANMMKGKTVQEIRALFNIENDFSDSDSD